MADAPFTMPTRLVLVRWEDACSYDEGGWISWEQVQEAELSFIQSTGFVAKETDKYIVLVGSICEEDGTAGSDVCIPKANIVEMRELV
jgi:hypothetical protein